MNEIYQVKVAGALDKRWSDCFNGMAVEIETSGDGRSTTTLTGPVADQARLRGILSRIWDLNLTIISVNQIRSGENQPNSQ